MTGWSRALVYLKRITLALERAHPPRPRRSPRPVDFSVATTADFDSGYDDRVTAISPGIEDRDAAHNR